MNTKLFGIIAFLFAGSSSLVQAQNYLPENLQKEEKEFLEAVAQVRRDYLNTESLEKFIARHPKSRFISKGMLELERANILSNSTNYFKSLQLYQFKPTERPLHNLYENLQELNGEDPDYKGLRSKYENLLTSNDSEYYNEANYYLGYIDYVEGNYEDALKHFDQLPSETKYSNTVPFYKMQILYAMGNHQETLDFINNKFLPHNLDSDELAEIIRIKAECYNSLGDEQNALDLFKDYINATESPLPVSAYNAAVLAFETGDYKLAEKSLSKAINSDNEHISQYSYMLLGQTFILTNEPMKAQMAFDQASAISADREVQEAALYNKAVLVHDTSYSPWGDEVSLFERFLNTYPGSKYADNVSTYLTEVYMTTKNYESALSSIKKIREPNQTILDAKQRLLYECGINDFVNGNYVSANNNFTEALSINSSNKSITAQSYYWRGESRYHLDALTDAYGDYQTFKSMSSSVEDKHLKAVANYSLGYVLFKKQNFAEAEKAFTDYTTYPEERESETYYDAVVRLGDCAYYSRDFVKAESYYSTVADGNNNSAPYALYQQAFMSGLQKKYSQKQNILDKLIALYPDNDYVDDAWLEKGNTSVLQNENNAAIKSFQYIVDNMPDSPCAPQAAVQLAMAYNNIGNKVQAQKIYEMVAEKYPNTDEAITAIQDLKAISTGALFAEMPSALEAGDYQKVIDNYNRLINENIDFRELQKIQLLAAKACLAIKDTDSAFDLLETCSEDIRTEAGSEAKYLLAQGLFDQGNIGKSQEVVTEFIQQGTTHQYWLARAIILLSDISIKNEDFFTATEYLKSLQSNYTANDDIKQMIETRLSNLK